VRRDGDQHPFHLLQVGDRARHVDPRRHVHRGLLGVMRF
jgi:hypothetical protein